jgi:pyrroline-5-carboxylate reductase
MLEEKIGVIGAGKIGSALLRGMIQTRLVRTDQLIASLPREAGRRELAEEIGIRVTGDNREVCGFADVVLLSVKPQTAQSVLREIEDVMGKDKLLVSVAAGVPISKIEDRLKKGARVVRVMTNTPCVVGAAASGYAGGSEATREDLKLVEKILSSVGIALPLDERLLDAVTGLSGSGPAYVFLFIESLADGGVQMGLPRDAARRLALQTVYGSAKLAAEVGKHLGQLRDEVTSPGGTTMAGLYALEKAGFRGALMDAVVQATRRAQELGKQS